MKKYWRFLATGLMSIRENKGRTFLTMLGIIIGVGSVILMTSLGRGAEGYILGSVTEFGPDLIYISPGSPDQGLLGGSIAAADRLKYRDFLELQRVDFLKDVTPFIAYDAIITYANDNIKTQVIGVNKNYTSAFNFDIGRGRFVDDNDLGSSARIAVMGIEAADDLFGYVDPLGEDIKIDGVTFKVVGVMEEQGGNAFENYDAMVFVPVTTLRTYLFNVDYVMTIVARVANPDELQAAIDQTRSFMRRLHRIDNPNNDLSNDDFQIITQDQALNIVGDVTNVMTYFIVGIASISLLVGGVGIMNIMYVSVNQRTREIGLRKAVGATNSDVLAQFLMEAGLISFLGGLIGIGFGLGLSYVIYLIVSYLLPGWGFGIDWNAVLVSSLVSALIGIFFGFYPAKRAASKDPIDALRYE